MRTPPRTTSMTIHCEVLCRRVFRTYYQDRRERESPDSFLFLFTNRQQIVPNISVRQLHSRHTLLKEQHSPQLLMLVLEEKVLGQVQYRGTLETRFPENFISIAVVCSSLAYNGFSPSFFVCMFFFFYVFLHYVTSFFLFALSYSMLVFSANSFGYRYNIITTM